MLPAGSYHVEGRGIAEGDYTIGAIGDGPSPTILRLLTDTATIGTQYDFDFSTSAIASRSRGVIPSKIYLPIIIQ